MLNCRKQEPGEGAADVKESSNNNLLSQEKEANVTAAPWLCHSEASIIVICTDCVCSESDKYSLLYFPLL